MKSFFSSTFRALTICDLHFCISKLSKLIFMGSSFHLFWSANYLNFGGVSCEIRILSRSIQETYTLRKVKNQVLLFLLSWEPNLFDLFCLFQNDILHRVDARILKPLSPFFSECSFYWLQHFFLYFWLSVWVEIYILNFLMSIQHLYNLTFEDKSVRVLNFHISNWHLTLWKPNGLSKHLKVTKWLVWN